MDPDPHRFGTPVSGPRIDNVDPDRVERKLTKILKINHQRIVDPDPHRFGTPVSGSVLRMWIRIEETGS